MASKINPSTQPACRLDPEQPAIKKLQSLVFQASEQRQIEKSNRLKIDWRFGLEGAEELLYQQLFRAVGYSHYAEPFVELAIRSPYHSTFTGPPFKEPTAILAQWLGELGLLQKLANHPQLETLRQRYLTFFSGEILSPITPKGRPSNDPVRRITGLFYHLDQSKAQGLVKNWLKFFYQVEAYLQEPKGGARKVSESLDQLFSSPGDEPLLHFGSFQAKAPLSSPRRFIGAERQRILLVNTVMPFFLSWALHSKDRALERTLFGLFMLLPSEGKNHKTEAMSHRLGLGLAPLKLKANLACHQGLIQFHDHLCGEFYENHCKGCPMPAWLNRS